MQLRGVFLGRGPGSLSPLGSHIHGVASEPQHLLQDGLKVMGENTAGISGAQHPLGQLEGGDPGREE